MCGLTITGHHHPNCHLDPDSDRERDLYQQESNAVAVRFCKDFSPLERESK
ncbi:MAG: hypothetical protein IIB82_15180 [Bacteroidetes bacterium]|nr:hypothetical protein [Bacteroidota bacterium]